MTQSYQDRAPYKIVVWGPGGIGQTCIREILKRPEFELVGVLAYSEAKIGIDVGQLIGQAPLGITISSDKEAIFAMQADVVLWCGLPVFVDPEPMHVDVIRLLESGKNVISPAGFHYPARQGKAYAERFESACRKGGASVYGTGVNPGYWFDRVVPTLTGLATSVESVFLDEYADCAAAGTGAELLNGIGFGVTPEQASERNQSIQTMWLDFYYCESMDMIAQSTWGRSVDRWQFGEQFHTAERDIVLDQSNGDPVNFTVGKGTVDGISYTFTGFIDEQPRVKTRVNWFLRPENSPFDVEGFDVWKIEIEAHPVSLRCRFDAFASLEGDLEFHPGEQFSMAWYATVVPMLQGIPVVVGAKPGIVVESVMANCVPDFRQLENRHSLVDEPNYALA